MDVDAVMFEWLSDSASDVLQSAEYVLVLGWMVVECYVVRTEYFYT